MPVLERWSCAREGRVIIEVSREDGSMSNVDFPEWGWGDEGEVEIVWLRWVRSSSIRVNQSGSGSCWDLARFVTL